MALNLYLDDCSNSDLLAELLLGAEHSVVRPTDPSVAMAGQDDDVHFSASSAESVGELWLGKRPKLVI